MRHSAVIYRILELIHEALSSNVVISKRYRRPSSASEQGRVALRQRLSFLLTISCNRNIYYRDPALFKKQSVVDRYVDILAFTFGVQRAALNVVGFPNAIIVLVQ